MNDLSDSSIRSQRVLILTSTRKDSELASKVLGSTRIAFHICDDEAALRRELGGGVGAVLTVEEALRLTAVEVLTEFVKGQPDWSDLPILLLTAQGAGSARVQQAVQCLGNVILLERPVRTATLISSVQSALRARERQYQVQDAHTQLLENEQRYKSMFDYHPDGAFIRDRNGYFLSINDAHETLLGYTLTDLQAMSFDQHLFDSDPDLGCPYFDAALRGEPQKFSTRAIRKDGRQIDMDVVYLPMVVNGAIVGLHGIARDVTQANSYRRRISYLANHDALTGLPNRSLLNDRLNHALEQAKRTHTQIGVMFLDLNRFKQVNDSFGHESGDQLLKVVASRLENAVREADTVARLGGDEFVVVLENIASIEDMIGLAQVIVETIEQPIELGGHRVSVSTSIGGSLFPKDATDAGTLLKYADMAMYQAKEHGAGAFRFYDRAMNLHVLERLLTENALRQALEKGELEVHYQPRVDVRMKKIVGVEALVRWNHPERGVILPADFIPLAEEIGLINDIGDWVLKTACLQNRLWQEQGLPPIKIAVNLSAIQLAAPDICQSIQDILARTRLAASCLELEITESSLMKNLELTCATLSELRELGVSIAMDDFGTGYSSLAQIKNLPVDTLKIDKSFVRNILEDQNDVAIVSATIALARHMGLKIVAEGVTSKPQMLFLAELECSEMQGYLFGRPRPASHIGELLNNPCALIAEMAA